MNDFGWSDTLASKVGPSMFAFRSLHPPSRRDAITICAPRFQNCGTKPFRARGTSEPPPGLTVEGTAVRASMTQIQPAASLARHAGKRIVYRANLKRKGPSCGFWVRCRVGDLNRMTPCATRERTMASTTSLPPGKRSACCRPSNDSPSSRRCRYPSAVAGWQTLRT